jgi:FkbM family methyltransferase
MTISLSRAIEEATLLAAEIGVILESSAKHSIYSKLSAIEACKANPYQPNVVWHEVFGKFMQLDLREEVSQRIFLHGCFEPELTRFFARYLKPSMVFYDVGAHIGYFSALCGRLVGETGTVVAFEPTQATRLHLETNLRNAQLSNATVRSEAVWSEATTITINDYGPQLSAFNSIGSARVGVGITANVAATFEVEAVSLDSVSLERMPDVVKIDVESSEWEVLNGMKAIHQNQKTIVTIEVGDFSSLEHQSIVPSRQLLGFMQEQGYQLFEPNFEGLVPHTINHDEPYRYTNIIAVPTALLEAIQDQIVGDLV